MADQHRPVRGLHECVSGHLIGQRLRVDGTEHTSSLLKACVVLRAQRYHWTNMTCVAEAVYSAGNQRIVHDAAQVVATHAVPHGNDSRSEHQGCRPGLLETRLMDEPGCALVARAHVHQGRVGARINPEARMETGVGSSTHHRYQHVGSDAVAHLINLDKAVQGGANVPPPPWSLRGAPGHLWCMARTRLRACLCPCAATTSPGTSSPTRWYRCRQPRIRSRSVRWPRMWARPRHQLS